MITRRVRVVGESRGGGGGIDHELLQRPARLPRRLGGEEHLLLVLPLVVLLLVYTWHATSTLRGACAREYMGRRVGGAGYCRCGGGGDM